MTEKLSKAWELFDSGNYTEAEKIYKESYASISSTDHDNYWQVLMELIYVESFTKNFSEARAYASLLVSSSIDQYCPSSIRHGRTNGRRLQESHRLFFAGRKHYTKFFPK